MRFSTRSRPAISFGARRRRASKATRSTPSSTCSSARWAPARCRRPFGASATPSSPRRSKSSSGANRRVGVHPRPPLGAAGELDKAVEYMISAARVAGRAWAKAEAVALYSQALDLDSLDDPRRHRLRLERATTLVQAGEFPQALPELDELIPGLEGRDRFEALDSRFKGTFWGLTDAEGSRAISVEAGRLAEELGDEELRAGLSTSNRQPRRWTERSRKRLSSDVRRSRCGSPARAGPIERRRSSPAQPPPLLAWTLRRRRRGRPPGDRGGHRALQRLRGRQRARRSRSFAHRPRPARGGARGLRARRRAGS